jgi:hypothetical protein
MNDTAKRNITESGGVHQFRDAFLRILDGPGDDPERYKNKLIIAGGRPDMTLFTKDAYDKPNFPS